MHEGFVNYNAGTEGPNMIEGRISAGVFVKKNSDLGGGSSTMGTLSGGNKEIITLEKGVFWVPIQALGFHWEIIARLRQVYMSLQAQKSQSLNENGKIVKAFELNGKNGMLYFRDSVSGKVCAKNKEDEFKLNKALHENN